MPSTLICDSAVSALMKTRSIAAVIVGADRVAANGDTANKIGTYQVRFSTVKKINPKAGKIRVLIVHFVYKIAVTAKYHSVPFYVAAPFTSIDFRIANGENILIEERPDREMTHVGKYRIAAPGIFVFCPLDFT